MSTDTRKEAKVYGDLKRVIYNISMGNRDSWLYPDCNRIGMFPTCHIEGKKLKVTINIYANEAK